MRAGHALFSKSDTVVTYVRGGSVNQNKTQFVCPSVFLSIWDERSRWFWSPQSANFFIQKGSQHFIKLILLYTVSIDQPSSSLRKAISSNKSNMSALYLWPFGQ